MGNIHRLLLLLILLILILIIIIILLLLLLYRFLCTMCRSVMTKSQAIQRHCNVGLKSPATAFKIISFLKHALIFNCSKFCNCVVFFEEPPLLNPPPHNEHSRPWFLLLTEFAGATTLHGVRYLVEPTRFLLRRYYNLVMF